MGFAGLYSRWRDPTRRQDDADRWVLTATIVTSAAPGSGAMRVPGKRHPVILPEFLWLDWIDPSVVGTPALVGDAVRAGRTEAALLRADRVAPFRASAEGPQLIQPTGSGSTGPR